MRRREFIAGLGGAAAWPLAARAQQPDRIRRIGLLMWGDENDPMVKTQVSALTQSLADLGWTGGRKVRIDLRWAGGDTNGIPALAQELVGLQPDILLATSTAGPLHSSGRRGRSRSSLWARAIPSPRASSRGSTKRPGTSPVLAARKPRWEASGLNCSRRSRPGSSGPHSCSIPMRSPYRFMCSHLKRRPDHSRSSQSPRPFGPT
jgi:hypothetical protein